MKRSILFLSFIITAAIFSGCGIYGIHLNLKNPRKAGKYPSFTVKDRLRGELSPYRTCYDVKHYSLNIAIDHAKKYIKGYVDIYAASTASFDTLQIDLYENMKISFIDYKGQHLGFKRKEGAVFVGMPAKMNAGEAFMLRVDYEGKPRIAPKPPWDGGFVWKTDKNKKPWIGVACEGLGASLWWPCKDHLGDEPDSSAINITVPSGMMCVANGRLRDSVSAGTQTTYKWFVSYPINTYNITFYAGDLKLLHDTYTSKLTGKTLDLDHYVLSFNYEKAKSHFKQLKPQLDYYEKYYGEYPWYRDGFKFVESPYAGMEHQSAIAYGNGYTNGPLGFDYIVLHETAHEWWGNSVTASDYADLWIHEGFATYCEALFVEQDRGKNAYLGYMLQERLFIKNERPVVGPKGVNYFNYKDPDPYMKGAWVLHTLRTAIDNDPLFLDILKDFQKQYREKTVTSQDFIALVNSKTGKDYTGFFRQYLYLRKVPVLEYNLSRDGYFAYRWAETEGSFDMPLRVKIGNNSFMITPTAEVKVNEINLDGVNTEINFPTDKALFIVKEVKRKKMKKVRDITY